MLTNMATKMTKKEMIARKNMLAHNVSNIREDYKHVNKEDIPADVTEEVTAMMAEMRVLRAALESK